MIDFKMIFPEFLQIKRGNFWIFWTDYFAAGKLNGKLRMVGTKRKNIHIINGSPMKKFLLILNNYDNVMVL